MPTPPTTPSKAPPDLQSSLASGRSQSASPPKLSWLKIMAVPGAAFAPPSASSPQNPANRCLSRTAARKVNSGLPASSPTRAPCGKSAWALRASGPPSCGEAPSTTPSGARMGIEWTRFPVASNTAFAITGAMAMMGISPAPADSRSLRPSRITSNLVTSRNRRLVAKIILRAAGSGLCSSAPDSRCSPTRFAGRRQDRLSPALSIQARRSS